MHCKLVIFFLICVISSFISPVSGQQLQYVQGEILIKIENDQNPFHVLKKYKKYKNANSKIQIEQVIKEPLNIWTVKIDYTIIDELAFSKDLLKDSLILAVQPNYISHYRLKPNDPQYSNQWQFVTAQSSDGIQSHTNIEAAWEISTGGVTTSGDTIVVCIIDDGISKNHEDLEGNLWINRFEIPGNGIDDDGNGYVDDYFGWDAMNDDDNVFREGGHGTSVAGLSGAIGNNGKGVTGVNWNVKLMILRGGNTVTNGIKAYTYPYMMRKRYNETNGQEGAFVVATNSSWGFDNRFASSAPIFCEFYDHLGAVGILNSTATTNRDVNVEEVGDLPTNCTSPYMIASTALRPEGDKISGAGFGNISIDLAAPAFNVFTTRRNNAYGAFSGTSASAPIVTGAIGLLYSMDCDYLVQLTKNNPSEAALLVKDILLGTVHTNPKMKGLTLTEGNLDIGAAASTLNDLCATCTYPKNVNIIPASNTVNVFFDLGNRVSADVRYREIGALNWSSINNITSPAIIQGLTICARYEFQLRSNCPGKSSYSYSYYIETDGCCSLPLHFELIEENNKVTAFWSQVTAASQYVLQFRKVGEQDWISEVTDLTTFQLNGFTSCTGLEFRVQTLCNDQETDFSTPENVSLNCGQCASEVYCEDSFMDNDFEWIEEVIFNDFRFKSGKNHGGYGNFIGLPGLLFKQGESIVTRIVPGFGSGSFSEHVAIYIDWNQDGIFHANELALQPGPASDTLKGAIKVPENALPGITRMRIILSFEAVQSPCKDFTLEYGEIEDYCIVVQSVINCEGFPSIDNFNTSSTEIQLVLSELASVDTYLIEYKMDGDSEFIAFESSSPNISIANLTACSSYDIRVAAFCNGENTGFSPIRNISTRCGTSVNEPKENENFNLYPNPFLDHLILEWNKHLPSVINLKMFDISGQVIQIERDNLEPNALRLSAYNHLPPGMYFLQIEADGKRTIKKVVKL